MPNLSPAIIFEREKKERERERERERYTSGRNERLSKQALLQIKRLRVTLQKEI